MQLDERKYRILQAIIDDYIMTAMPVGSRTISRKSGVGFSPATIRNEMSDLEELGYLAQPHTSAGRVPSYKAYRLYVDHLMKTCKLTSSDATKYTSVIVAPKLGTLRIKHVQLVPVAERTALMIIVTTAGIVKDAVIRVPEELDADDLYGISRILTQRLGDQPLEGVRQAFADLLKNAEQNRKLLGEALQVIEKRLEQGGDASDVIVGGSANLLEYPEYSDVNKARSFLSVLESKDTLRRLMGREGSMEVSIRIGPENEVPELDDCSIVTASYRVGDHSTGTLGIIGPTRMNYTRVISVLDFMGRALSDVLSEYK